MTITKLYIYIGVEVKDLYIDEAHTALDIFRFTAFLKQDIKMSNGQNEAFPRL